MWGAYFHHILLHFPIVLPFVVSALGLGYVYFGGPEELKEIVRWVGWMTFGLTTLTVISGLVAAPGWIGEEGSRVLGNHRNLGLTTWVVIGLAALSIELGERQSASSWCQFGIGVWCVAAFVVVGTGHWGGSEVHSDKIPWQESPNSAAPDKSKTSSLCDCLQSNSPVISLQVGQNRQI